MTYATFEPWTSAELAERYGISVEHVEHARALAPRLRAALPIARFVTSRAAPVAAPSSRVAPSIPTAVPSRSAENERNRAMNSHQHAHTRGRDAQKARTVARGKTKPSAAAKKPQLSEQQIQKIIANAKRQLQAFNDAPASRRSSAPAKVTPPTDLSVRTPTGADMDRVMGLDRSRDGVHRNEQGKVCFSPMSGEQAAARRAELDREALSRVMTLAESDAQARGKNRVAKSSLVSAAHMRPNAGMDHAMRAYLPSLEPKRVVYRANGTVRFTACTADEARALLTKKQKENFR